MGWLAAGASWELGCSLQAAGEFRPSWGLYLMGFYDQSLINMRKEEKTRTVEPRPTR